MSFKLVLYPSPHRYILYKCIYLFRLMTGARYDCGMCDEKNKQNVIGNNNATDKNEM